jgi:hypothetical protein
MGFYILEDLLYEVIKVEKKYYSPKYIRILSAVIQQKN